MDSKLFLIDKVPDEFNLTEEQIIDEIVEMEDLFGDRKHVESRVGSGTTPMAVMPIGRQVSTFNKQFNDIEWNKIKELSDASRIFYEHTVLKHSVKNCFSLNKIAEMYKLFPNVVDQFITSTVQYCKSISTFDDICEDDKLVLVKTAYWQLICLSYLPTFDFKKGHWIYFIVSLHV